MQILSVKYKTSILGQVWCYVNLVSVLRLWGYAYSNVIAFAYMALHSGPSIMLPQCYS